MPGICPRCNRSVFFAEEKTALGHVWHTFCFSCYKCRKLLDSTSLTPHKEEIFCSYCYKKHFGSAKRTLPPINLEQIEANHNLQDSNGSSSHKSFTGIGPKPRAVVAIHPRDNHALFNSRKFFSTPHILQVKDTASKVASALPTRARQSIPQLVTTPEQAAARGWQKSASSSTLMNSPEKTLKATESAKSKSSSVDQLRKEGSAASAKLLPEDDLPSNASSATYSEIEGSIERLVPGKIQGDQKIPGSGSADVPRRCGSSQSHITTFYSRFRLNDGNSENPRSLLLAATECSPDPGEVIGVCRRCDKTVYHTEILRAGGSVFHTVCFACVMCRRRLEMNNVCTSDGEIYCKQCHMIQFGVTGYGFGAGGGVLHTPPPQVQH